MIAFPCFLLGEVCHVSMGQAPAGNTYNGDGLGYPLIAGAGDFGELTPAPGKWTTSPTKLSKHGDIILCIRATIGDRNWADKEYCLGRGVAGLRPNEDRLDVKYLWHWIGFSVEKLKEKGRGATFLQVSKSDITSLEIPLPDLAEQKRIATILDAADALRAKRREGLAQLDALIQSAFLDMFGDPVMNTKGWPMVSIGDLLESATYGTSKKASEDRAAYPILRMGNITYAGQWDFSRLKYIDLDESEASKFLVHKGQILFNRTNSKELVGKTAVYRRDEPMAFAGYLVKGVTNDRANPEYIGAFMNTPQIKSFLQAKCKSIVGMANINAKEFQAIPIPVPPIGKQNQFGLVVESIERQRHRLATHLDALDLLFSSLQSRAFNGGL